MEKKDALAEIKNRIWITSKSRITAEKRLKHYDVVAHVSLSLLSTIIVGISVFADNFPTSAPIAKYTIVLSILVLVFSVIVFGFRFGQSATLHRECYLRLDKLRDKNLSAEELQQEYHEILSAYPNHSSLDYEKLILDRTLFSKAGMTDSLGTSLSWTLPMLVKYAFSFLVLWSIPIVIIVGSVGSLFWFW